MNTREGRAPQVLVVDDMEEARRTLGQLLTAEGFEPLLAEDGRAAIELLRGGAPDVVLLDHKLPGMDGMQVLAEAQRLDRDTPIIMLTAFGTVASAVEAVKSGAYDYLTKPFENNELIFKIRRAVENRSLREENRTLRSRVTAEEALPSIMGPSDQVRRICAEVECVAPTDFTVIITGETGAGKEVVARAIHRLSRRAAAPFVPVDCGSIAPTLVESELFGHEKGAFTGALQSQQGKFELATGGTLFLDEISNLPLSLQVKLLRALQEKQVCRVGGRKWRPVDIRILTATNRDLASIVASGEFRQDLYHRLNEFAIRVPALRERPEDILFLAKRFLDLTNRELNKNVQGLSADALMMLQDHPWPGNVRELRNVIRRAVLLAGIQIGPEHLQLARRPPADPNRRSASSEWNRSDSLKQIVRRKMQELERDVLIRVLKETGGNKARAARLLQIDYKTMHTKVREYGISCQSSIQ